MRITLKEIDEEKDSYQPIKEWTIDMQFPQVPAKGDKINIFIEKENIIFEVKEVIYYTQPTQDAPPAEVELLLTRRDTYADFVKGLMEGG